MSLVKKVKLDKWPIVKLDEDRCKWRIEKLGVEVPKLRVGRPDFPVAFLILAGDPELYVEALHRLPSLGAIVGTCTMCSGIQYMVANIIANPNIRYLVVAGREYGPDGGWPVGKAVAMLYLYGTLPDGRIPNVDDSHATLETYKWCNMLEVAVQRFRQQIQLLDLMNVEDIEPNLPVQKVEVGSKVFYIPCRTWRGNDGKLHIELPSPIPRKYLLTILELIAHAGTQEPENAVVIHAVGKYLGPHAVEVYNKEPFPVEPIIIPIFTDIKPRTTTTGEKHLELEPIQATGELLSPAFEIHMPNFRARIVPQFRLVYAEATDIFIGYKHMVDIILRYGWEIETRHGKTREVQAVITYYKLPRIELEFENGKVKVLNVEPIPDWVKKITLSLPQPGTPPAEGQIAQYIEQILNGEPDWSKQYTYGERLRRWGLQLEKAYKRLTAGTATPVDTSAADYVKKLAEIGFPRIDQLENVVKILVKDRGARYAILEMWDTTTDNTQLINDPPCWNKFQFLIRNNTLVTAVYCRSHDFGRAHIDNMYFVSVVIHYIAKRLTQEGVNIEIGPCTAIIWSCHIYT